MAALLSHLERFLERAFEAPARRFFRPRLQPVELARAVGRAMEADSQVGPEGLQVPNRYLLALHPDDLRAFADWRGTLQHDLNAYAEQRVLNRGWHSPGGPMVEVREDPSVPRGEPRVSTSTVDVPPAQASQPLPTRPSGLDRTFAQPARRPSRDSAPLPPATAWLELPGAGRFPLSGTPVRLGRALDNDVVLDDSRVSRYHAQIRRQGDRFVVVDLGSTNGTQVGARSVTQQPLRTGDTIYLGGVPVRFHGGR